jgi:hypothetical protein
MVSWQYYFPVLSFFIFTLILCLRMMFLILVCFIKSTRFDSLDMYSARTPNDDVDNSNHNSLLDFWLPPQSLFLCIIRYFDCFSMYFPDMISSISFLDLSTSEKDSFKMPLIIPRPLQEIEYFQSLLVMVYVCPFLVFH